MRRNATLLGILALLVLAGPVVPEEKRMDDGRAGSVADLQGTALVRPVGRARWSPVSPRTVLMPGDLVRTMLRGAHAVEIRLGGGGTLVLGPGGLVEIPAAGHVRLMRGEAELSGVKATGPGGFEAEATGKLLLRASDGATKTLSEPPAWLTGYRSSTTDEWMGSLVADVDGRNVPLRVGYHKVSVVIRDQIAETTVEESFVNATRQTLEGVFTFPLPADASISGFGMWVGDELVMADIVERQRARAIYEDILRRRKDPGLLEWSGGNLFKARVFPIPAGGEKRIRIRYTQVLPLEGTTIRYRYALRSELLRTHPLRQLAIKVSVDSTAPIRSAASPTHEVRARVTEHSAVLEFDAEEYRPDRDFEAAIRLDRSRPLTVVPHRRGEDGYFMLLLSPPDPAAGDWERGLLPEGEPLHLVLVADTSSSMDDAARKAQAELIQALLSLLGPEDSFELATSDVTVRWFRERPAPVTERNVDDAIAFLAARDSLGWTDLDLALSEATAKAAAGAHVVYLGDGIPTARDPDPVAQARRIEALREDAKAT
ncbi:MAG: VIT domain-containing protein, partial [Planctomycetota bacterium]